MRNIESVIRKNTHTAAPNPQWTRRIGDKDTDTKRDGTRPEERERAEWGSSPRSEPDFRPGHAADLYDLESPWKRDRDWVWDWEAVQVAWASALKFAREYLRNYIKNHWPGNVSINHKTYTLGMHNLSKNAYCIFCQCFSKQLEMQSPGKLSATRRRLEMQQPGRIWPKWKGQYECECECVCSYIFICGLGRA